MGVSVQGHYRPCRKRPLCHCGPLCGLHFAEHGGLPEGFIHADLAFRAKRIVEVYGEREQSPEERLRDKDKRRAAYHRFYTDMKWGYAQNYHLTLDSGVLGIDKCVDIIAELF